MTPAERQPPDGPARLIADFEEVLYAAAPWIGVDNPGRALVALKKSWPQVRALLNRAAPSTALLDALDQLLVKPIGAKAVDFSQALAVAAATYERYRSSPEGARRAAEAAVIAAADEWRRLYGPAQGGPANRLTNAVDALAALDAPPPPKYEVVMGKEDAGGWRRFMVRSAGDPRALAWSEFGGPEAGARADAECARLNAAADARAAETGR